MPIHNYLACTLYEIGLPVSTDAYVNLNVGPAKDTRRACRKLARLHFMIHIHNQLNYSFQFLLCRHQPQINQFKTEYQHKESIQIFAI